MDAERWQRLSPLLDALIDLEPEARAARLAELRAEDPALTDELEQLLALEEDNTDFLSEPLIAPPPSAKADSLIGPYRLERMLGEGGMGQVWLARRADGLYQRRVALKLLRPGLADPNLRQRFTRERQILARLGHPHIARLLDAGIGGDGQGVQNQPYLALEYVEGEPITDWCRSRDLTVEERLRLFLQVCEAVSHAHANLIVHRDLKPSNILVTALDEVRLLDFGIAKLLDSPEPGRDHTRTEVRAFTLHYAAPEQIRGEPVTTMTDVYSLGVVLYELLAETKPYKLARQSDAAWEEAILLTDPLRPSQGLLREADSDPSRTPALRRRAKLISGDLDNIVLKALSKRAEHRYASVEALAQDLLRHLEGKPVLARPQSLAYRTHKFLQRNRWALATAGLFVGVLTAALVLVTWQGEQARREAARAQALQDFIAGLFEQAGGRAGPGPLDVRQLLSDGEARAESELANQPLSQAELFGVIARLRLGLGDYPQALRLLQRQQALLKTLPDAPESLRLSAATDSGRTLRLLGRAGECVARMRPQETLARGLQRNLPGQAADFHSELGRCQHAVGELDTARLLFQRSIAIRRNTLEDMAGTVENLGDLAALERDAGNVQAALRGYRNALAQLEASEGNRHRLAIGLRRNLCAMERASGELGIAERDCHDALTLALDLQGVRHPDTIDVTRELAAIHVDMGRYREAEKAFIDSRRWLQARLGSQHADVARDDNSLGIIAWERGQTQTALRHLDRALAVLEKQPQNPLLAGVLFNKAMVLHESGRSAEALPLLKRVRALRIAHGGERHKSLAMHARLHGEVLDALGRREAAGAELEQALQRAREGYGLTHPNTRRAELALVRHLLAHIDDTRPAGEDERADRNARVDNALARLDALSTLPPTDPELRKIAWIAAARAAAWRCLHPQHSGTSPTEADLEDAVSAATEAGFGAGAAADDLSGSGTLQGTPPRAPTPREQLAELAVQIETAFPEGGSVVRDFEGIRKTCR